MKNKRLIDILMSKSFRSASKQFIIWIIIFTLFIILFIQSVSYVKDNMPNTLKPSIKEEDKETVDAANLRIENEEKTIVGNITIT